MVENASKMFFSRDLERPFDTERPRNWGSFGAELNGLKPWRRGGCRCFLGGWLVVENASTLSFFYRDPERPFDTERPRNWGSFGAELNGLKPWRRGGFRCFLGGWLVVENASKLSFFYRDPERPFDTERPRNWGSFGAELNGLKPWRRGGFRCFLGGWLVVENARKVFFSRDPERPFDTERPRNWGSFGAEVKAVAKGWFQMLLGGWKAFGRLLVEAFWGLFWSRTQWVKSVAKG